ncbi:MAG: DsbA family oxidoreductase [Chloroflexi bacterium]|nr:DsbA family oxidoreductase [Chloroflexota bacterium]
MAVVNIEVYSDVVCPWCFVGRKRLEKAVHLLDGKHEIHVTWKPYQLNSWIPPEGMDRAEYRRMKFGSAERSSSMDNRLAEAGRGEGIELAFDRITRTPNTLAAHRLIWLAEREGRQIEMVDTLFQAYFTDGKDIGNPDQLTELAAAAGLDADAVRAFLATDEGLAEVEAEEEAGRGLGIDGVPFFLLAGKYGVSGAQPAEVLVDVIERVVELERPKTPELLAVGAVATGATCSVDDPENC